MRHPRRRDQSRRFAWKKEREGFVEKNSFQNSFAALGIIEEEGDELNEHPRPASSPLSPNTRFIRIITVLFAEPHARSV